MGGSSGAAAQWRFLRLATDKRGEASLSLCTHISLFRFSLVYISDEKLGDLITNQSYQPNWLYPLTTKNTAPDPDPWRDERNPTSEIRI